MEPLGNDCLYPYSNEHLEANLPRTTGGTIVSVLSYLTAALW